LKKLTQLALLLATVLGFTSQANASLLIEPVVGYSYGKFNSEVEIGPVSEKNDDSLSGTSYGGRLGYQNFGFQIGLDYLASNMSYDSNDLKTQEWGGFVGFEFPILVRVYAGYVFSGSGTAEFEDVDGDVNLKGGTGPKIGVGFTLLPFLDINVEYRRISYDSKEEGVRTIDSDYSATTLSFSLPFAI
jgi:hypothetical protein